MIQPKPYHHILLLCCGIFGLIHGILSLVHGSDAKSRFYRLVRYVIPLVGVASIVFSVLLLARRFWAIDWLIFLFVFSLSEELLTFRPELEPIAKRFGVFRLTIFHHMFVTVLLGTPAALLIWLRPEFTN
jgi:hypothetical protein